MVNIHILVGKLHCMVVTGIVVLTFGGGGGGVDIVAVVSAVDIEIIVMVVTTADVIAEWYIY